ncbi:MAG: hypothetical protein ABI175_06360, partial [Polyangiales bacterium]
MEPPLALERYAELSAEIDSGALRDQVLHQAGVTLDAWFIVQQFWLDLMASEARARKFETSRRFQQIYVTRRRALAARGIGRVPTKAPTSAPYSFEPPSSQATRPMPAPEAAAPLQAGFGVNVQASGPRLTLPQYASLCVELAVAPEQTDAIRGRYGFDEPG